MQAFQSFEHYSISEKAMDYRILHMDEDQDRMYVGCKDHVLSMDINNITHGTLKVSRCFLMFPVINIAMLESILSHYTTKEKIKSKDLMVCKADIKKKNCCSGIILICAIICKLAYICHHQKSFRVIHKRPKMFRAL